MSKLLGRIRWLRFELNTSTWERL